MTVLHMEPEACEAIRMDMVAKRQQMAESANALLTSINQMVGSTWVAPAANQFLGDYTQVNQMIGRLMEALDQLANSLEYEVNEWRGVADSF